MIIDLSQYRALKTTSDNNAAITRDMMSFLSSLSKFVCATYKVGKINVFADQDKIYVQPLDSKNHPLKFFDFLIKKINNNEIEGFGAYASMMYNLKPFKIKMTRKHPDKAHIISFSVAK